MRQFFTLLVIAILVFASCGKAPVSDTDISNDDWFGSGKNTLRSGMAAGELLPPFGSLWVYEMPGIGISSASVATVPPTTDLAVKGVSKVVFVASGDKTVHALDFANGGHIWGASYPAQVGDPVYSGGKVVFLTSDGVIQCNDAWDGTELWVSRYSTTQEITREECSPVISGGYVFAGFSSGLVMAFDMVTGFEVWREKMGDRINSSPIVVQGKVIFASYSGDITAFNVATGEIKWTGKLRSPSISNLVSDGNVVYACGAFGTISAFDVKDGVELWNIDVNDTIRFSPCITTKGLTVPCDSGSVKVFDLENGDELMSFKTPLPSSGLTCASNLVVFNTQDGKLGVCNVESGDMAIGYEFATWQEGVMTQRFGDIAIVDGMLFTSDGLSKLFCLAPKDIARKAHSIEQQAQDSTTEDEDPNSEEEVVEDNL